MKKVRRFKFLGERLKSKHDGHQWEIGKWYKTECKELCHGFNCSKRIIDALSYVRGEILAEVEVRGKKFIGDDKSTHAEMRVIKAWEWGKIDSVELAIIAAELVIDIYEKIYPNDDRPRKAIEAAKSWLGNPTDAADAAYVVANAAANAANAAADAAANAAYVVNAVYAVYAAANAAANAAYAAAYAATHAANAAADAAHAAADAAYAAYAAAHAANAAADAAHAAYVVASNKIEDWLLAHIETLKEIT